MASKIKITISARLHLFCFSYHCLSVSVLNSPVWSRVTCARLGGFRLNLPHIYLPEMKKIHPVLYIKFSYVFSNAYDKTELVNHAAKGPKAQRKEDGSKQHCKLTLSWRAPLSKLQTATILTLTFITGTINLCLFCRRDFLSLPRREFI